MKAALSRSAQENVLLSNKANIAEQTVGHAYNRGMYDRMHITSELERALERIQELESEN